MINYGVFNLLSQADIIIGKGCVSCAKAYFFDLLQLGK